MEDLEDDQICKVCRTEGTPDHPLFYPCKCRGSIKYVHQDCLEQWIRHSKATKCEVRWNSNLTIERRKYF